MTPGTEPAAHAVEVFATVRRRVRQGPRPTSVVCAGCGRAVVVAARGPLPKWCGQTCRQRSWERRRAATELTTAPGPVVVVREVVETPVTVRPQRGEWVAELAELTRQLAAAEIPDGCLHEVYEALTVAINQLVHRNRNGYGKQQGYLPHPALPGREDVIAAQLDTTTLGSPTAQARLVCAWMRPVRDPGWVERDATRADALARTEVTAHVIDQLFDIDR